MKRCFFSGLCTLCLIAAIALTGCSTLGTAENSVLPPQASESAETWDSQKSEAMLMYEEAVAAGYEGDYLSFLRDYLTTDETGGSDASDGSDGSDGDGEILGCDMIFPAVGADGAALSVVSIHSTFNVRQYGWTATSVAAGAGVVFSIDDETLDTYIITNYHVVYERTSTGNESVPHISDDIEVWLYGNETDEGKLSAAFFGGAIDYDVAVLFIDGDKTVNEPDGGVHTNASVLENSAVRPVALGNSDSLTVGDVVYALGNPNGEGIAASRGIVSVPAEYIEMEALNSAARTVSSLEIRIDAAVNHGNSGGGLFNLYGECIGTVNARSEEDGVRDFGYAIPGNLVIAIARNVIDNGGAATFAQLGFQTEISSSKSVYDEKTGSAKIEERVSVTANYEGLRAGDIILSVEFDGASMEVNREYRLTVLAFDLRSGDTVNLRVLRDGEEAEISFTLSADDFIELS